MVKEFQSVSGVDEKRKELNNHIQETHSRFLKKNTALMAAFCYDPLQEAYRELRMQVCTSLFLLQLVSIFPDGPLSCCWWLLFVMGSIHIGPNSRTCHHIQIVLSPSTFILSDQTCLLYVYLCRSVSWTTITYGGPDLGGLVNACGLGLDTLLDSSMLPLQLHRSILTRHRPSLVREGKTWGWSSVLQHETRWSSHGWIMTWHGLPTQFSSISVCWVPFLSLSLLL